MIKAYAAKLKGDAIEKSLDTSGHVINDTT